MLKRFNQYLVTNHPQLWNTRLPHMLLAILVTHVLFFIAGYLHFDSWDRLHRYYNINSQFVRSENIGFSVLVSVILLIAWLVFYLRNNPFKSFYPLKPLYFVTEFSIILLITFGSITFYKSYASGFCYAIKKQTASVNLVKDVNTYNLARGFLPDRVSDYGIHNCCDSIEYIDSLQHISEKYRHVGYDPYDSTIFVDYTDTVVDSIVLAIANFMQRKQIESDFSFRYYCNIEYSLDDSVTYTARQVSEQMQLWLATGNKKQIEVTLDSFEKLCNRYVIYKDFDTRLFAGFVFATPNFEVQQFVNTSYNDKAGLIRKNYIIEFDQIDRAITNIYRVRNDIGGEKGFWLLNIVGALALAVFLFSFRLSPIRVWFAAIAVALLVILAIGLLDGVMYAAFYSKLYIGFLLLFVYVLTYILHFIFRKRMKKTAGVLLVMVTWGSVPLLWVVYGLLKEIYEPIGIAGEDGVITYTSSPFHDFLVQNAVQIGYAICIVIFLYIGFVFTRHYRKWMALPEE